MPSAELGFTSDNAEPSQTGQELGGDEVGSRGDVVADWSGGRQKVQVGAELGVGHSGVQVAGRGSGGEPGRAVGTERLEDRICVQI